MNLKGIFSALFSGKEAPAPPEKAAGNVIAGGECGTDGDNVTWVLNENGTLRISGSGRMRSRYSSPFRDYSREIERAVIDEGVTNVSDLAFYGCSRLREIILPAAIEQIGINAFQRTAFFDDESNWSGDMLYIGKNLITVRSKINGRHEIRPNTRLIADYAFCGCRFTEAAIPDSVKNIGSYAFSDCASLGGIRLPSNISALSDSLFSGCTGLKTVTIPSGVKKIGDWAFNHCSALTDVYFSGSEDDWYRIDIGFGNYALQSASLHFNAQQTD